MRNTHTCKCLTDIWDILGFWWSPKISQRYRSKMFPGIQKSYLENRAMSLKLSTKKYPKKFAEFREFNTHVTYNNP